MMNSYFFNNQIDLAEVLARRIGGLVKPVLLPTSFEVVWKYRR